MSLGLVVTKRKNNARQREIGQWSLIVLGLFHLKFFSVLVTMVAGVGFARFKWGGKLTMQV